MPGRLEGSVAIVTAGGQGIGDSIAQLFARESGNTEGMGLPYREGRRLAQPTTMGSSH